MNNPAAALAVLAIFISLALSLVVWNAARTSRQEICESQLYIGEKLARSLEIAAPTHLSVGRSEVFTEFNSTVKELRALKC